MNGGKFAGDVSPACARRDIGVDCAVRTDLEVGNAPNKLGKERALSLAILAASIPPAAQTAMLGALVSVREARLERRALSGEISSPLSWFAVIALGVLTQIAIAVVQLDKARPQALALFVFTAAFALTIALIALGERPFSGRIINDGPLREAIASVNA